MPSKLELCQSKPIEINGFRVILSEKLDTWPNHPKDGLSMPYYDSTNVSKCNIAADILSRTEKYSNSSLYLPMGTLSILRPVTVSA